MTNRILAKFQQAVTLMYTQAKKLFLHSKARLFTNIASLSSSKKNNSFNFIKLITERWRTFSLGFIVFMGLYYGLGAAVSSKINNTLNLRQQTSITSSLMYVLKTQIDETPWTPALPAIFPASVLDNLPNFQIGAKESAGFFITRIAQITNDENLKEATRLLSYPPDIWLFSKTGTDTFSPGSAKQYRKAIDKISRFEKYAPTVFPQNTQTFRHLLESINTCLEKQISRLDQHTQEHNTDLLDLKADDIFYRSQGAAYTIHYLLTGLAKNYQDIIVSQNRYSDMTTAMKYLSSAIELNPLSVKNASPNDLFSANHLLYLAYYLSQTRNYLQEIYYSLNPLDKSNEH